MASGPGTDLCNEAATQPVVSQGGSLMNYVVLGNQQASDTLPVTSLAAVNVGAVNKEAIENNHSAVMALQPGQTHNALQISQAQLLQHHQQGGQVSKTQQHPDAIRIQQQQQQQQHDQARLHQQQQQQQQQHRVQIPVGTTIQQSPHVSATSNLASSPMQVPVLGTQAGGHVVSTTHQELQQPVRNIHPKQKASPIHVQNTPRMATPLNKQQLSVSQQQLLRQYKQGQMHQHQPVNPRMQTHPQQPFPSNKVAMMHQTPLQQGMVQQGLGAGMGINNMNSQKSGMQSPPRTPSIQVHSPHGMPHLQAQHTPSPHLQAQHLQTPLPKGPQTPHQQTQNSPTTPHEQTGSGKGNGDNLAGQTITVEAVECTPMQGQTRRLIKLVVSGAKGQAHSILSKNQQLQQQIMHMMHKALTSTAEVSFPSDPEQPIRVTCKPNTDTNVSAAGDSTRKPPHIPMSAGSPDPNAQQQLVNRNNTNACGTPVPRVASPRSHMAGMGMMTPRQVNLQSPPPMSTSLSQQAQSPHGSIPTRFGKPGKRMTTPEQYVRNILQNEAQAASVMKAKEKKPVGVVAQFPPQSMTMLQQQLSQGARPQALAGVPQQQRPQDEAGSSAVPVAGTLPPPVQATKESGSIKVISPAKSGIDNPQKFIAGNDYTIECPNGKRIVGTWDGKYFKVKNPVSDNQSQAGKTPKYMQPPKSTTPKSAALKSSKSSTPKTSAKVPIVSAGELAGMPILSMSATKQLLPKPQMSVACVDEQGINIATLARSEPQPIQLTPSISGEAPDSSMPGSVPVEQIRKRPLIPKQEGKYAVCDNCGNLSSDYETCESCKRPLPDDPKLFAPNASGTQLILLPNSGTMGPQQFYANKLVHQAILQKSGTAAAILGRGRGRGLASRGRGKSPKGRGRGRGGNMSHEPDTVTILSSDEDGEETRAPAHKFPRLDRGVLMGKKLKMEDETGKVVLKPNLKKPATLKSANISAAKVTEQKSGGNTVIRMVDPVIQLSAQAVRIGSMQSIPVSSHVEFSLKGFRMMLKLPTESGVSRMVDVRVEAREIIEISACFSRFLVLFIRVSPPCALRIRNRCGMEVNSEHYFDPNSKLDCHKHLTVLMSQWNQRDQEIFKAVCRKMESDKMCGQAKILSTLGPDKANDMLVQASYVGPQLKKKPATTVTAGGQVLTTTGMVTSGGLVASQVLINQGGIISQVLHMPGQALPAGHVILSLPAAQVQKAKTSSVDGDEEEEPIDRSRSPSPLLPSFAGPVVRLFTYPPAPITGGIPVTNEDLFCLNEGEFLNDVIIDFYLKYLINEVLTDEDKDRTHVFSSFFYRRLTQKQNKRHMADDQQNMTAQEKRHSRVKTWTRHVDLFDKDFVIVPINESAHWYLAIICFPGLLSPIIEEEPETPPPSQLEVLLPANVDKDGEDSKQSSEGSNVQTDGAENSEQSSSTPQSTQDEPKPEQNRPKAGGGKPQKLKIRRTVLQPTILIFDSLSGPGRTGVVRTLREYIQVEWNIKKAELDGARVFTKDNMRGCITKCPQQTNFSDCGVFVLQYVESFFKTPIRDYSVHPMDLNNWFPDSCVKQKREELRLLILDLQQELNAELDYDPTQDGCIGTSPSHMVTIPLSMDGSQMQTPVIMSLAGGINVVQQTIAAPQMAMSNASAQEENEPQEPINNEAQHQEQFSDAPELNNCETPNIEALHSLNDFAGKEVLPEQENTVSEGLQGTSQEESAYDNEQSGITHGENNGQLLDSMHAEQTECDQMADDAQHMSSMHTVQQENALQCEHYVESEQYLEHENAMDYDGIVESAMGHVETAYETEQSVTEESEMGHSQGQDAV